MKKLSQDEVAKKLDVHGAVIGRYERDEVKPSIEVAVAIAEALEVSLDYLSVIPTCCWKKILLIKWLIFKNWVPKTGPMYLPCSMLFCNPTKQKKYLPNKN